MTARYIIGDTRDVTADMPDASVDLVLTSPPFLALRSYLPDDHPDKHREIGSEATPADFLDVLLDLTEEWARVLTPHGSIVVELGDTYAGSGGGGGDYLPGGLRENQPGFGGSAERQRDGNAAHWRQKNAQRDAWPLDKSLCGIPWLYTMSLAYGRNLLRPERTTDPWRIRNVIAWCRPNPPVGALGDKFRPGTSYMTVATKARDRWFDLDAVRDPHKVPEAATPEGARHKVKNHSGANPRSGWTEENDRIMSNPAGAPPLDWWQVSTEPYAGSHYATWPRKLLTRPILAMCPERVCTTCGQPSRRITSTQPMSDAQQAIAHTLREAREAKGLTVKEVAAHFPSRTGGLTGCVSNWETAANVPTAGQWPKLKELLGITTDAFDPYIYGDRSWTESTTEYVGHTPNGTKAAAGRAAGRFGYDERATAIRGDAGWSDCGHDTWRPGIVLDPFAGSGTTLAVATGHGRDAIGIDIDARNADLATERVGPMFIDLEHHTKDNAA